MQGLFTLFFFVKFLTCVMVLSLLIDSEDVFLYLAG